MKDLSLAAVEAMSNLGNETNQKVELKILKEITPFGEMTMFEGVDSFMGGHPFMVGKRVAELLEIKNSSRAVSNLSKSITLGEYFDEYSVVSQYDTTDKAHKTMVSSLQKQFTNSWRSVKLIQIGGLFELIGKSRKPKAIEFGEFVNYEILPKIARTGEYSINNKKDKEIARLKDLLITQNEQKALVRILLTNANAKRLVENPTKYIIVKSHLRETLSYDERVQLLEKKRVTEREELEAQSKASFKEFRDSKVIEWKKIHYNYSLQMQDLINISLHDFNSSALIRRYEMVLEDEFLHNKQVIIDDAENKKKALEEELNAQIEQLNNDIDAELKLEKQGMDEVDFLVNAINQGIIKIENQPSTEITEF